MERDRPATTAMAPVVGSIGNRLFGERPLDVEQQPSQMSELRALRIEVDRLRSRLAQEAAYRTELEAAVVNLTGNMSIQMSDELLPDAFAQFFNAEDPQHALDRNFLLH